MATEHEVAGPEPITQAEFRVWLDRRPDPDRGHYELLNGRIVVSPPAGWPHGQIESTVVRVLAEDAERRCIGRVLGSSAGFDLPSGDTLASRLLPGLDAIVEQLLAF